VPAPLVWQGLGCVRLFKKKLRRTPARCVNIRSGGGLMVRQLQTGALLAVVAATVIHSGCSISRLRSRDSVESFAQRYVAFCKDRQSAMVVSYVSIVPAMEAVGKEDYFYYLKRALDRHDRPSQTASDAQTALQYYQLQTLPVMEEWANKDGKLREHTLSLIQTANAIPDGEFRSQAIRVADAAQDLHQALERKRRLCLDRFEAQTKLLKELVAAGGRIRAVWPTLEDAGATVNRLAPLLDKAEEDVLAANDHLTSAYAAFKGMTGTAIDAP